MKSRHEDCPGRARSFSLQEQNPEFSQIVDAHGCVRVQGDLTHRTAGQLRGTVEGLRRGGLSRVVVDLRGLRSTDEAGLSSLEATRAAMEADGGRLTVLAPPPASRTTRRLNPVEK